MKKLIITAAIVCVAAMSQASIVTWGFSNAVEFNGTPLGNHSVALYMVGTAGAADVLIDTRTTSNKVKTRGTLELEEDSSGYTYQSTVAGGEVWNATVGDVGRSYYIVMTKDDGTDFFTYTSSAVASTGLSPTSLGTVTFTINDTQKAPGEKDGWVSNVPEPTSGLLLLLGMAGMALRRRRA